METPDRLYQALKSHDARFDGRFFTGVVTTGVYCRPICPAPTPKARNVRFFPCAAAAEQAGFRPCRRCRPETAPGTPAWAGTSGTVSRALRLISEGAMDRGGVDELAARLGVGARHLRRLFDQHLGASPVAVAQSRRVHFARGLLDQTSLPMSEVAYASGFCSVKRFNTVIRDRFGKPPSELRHLAADRTAPVGDGITLRLPYRPPYEWDAMLDYLARRATPGVEEVVDGVYRRSALVDDTPAVLEVRPAPERNQLIVRVNAPVRRDLMNAVERVRRLFDLGADPMRIAAHLERDRRLRLSVRKRPGLRVPGAWDPFEITVRAILGQQVSVRGATTLAGRLAERYGTPIENADSSGPRRLFPLPERLARARIERIGIPKSRASAIRGLARRVADGSLPLAWGQCPEDTRERLVEIPGVGDWTAQYVALRALGEPDVFLPGDLGVRRALTAPGEPLPTAQQTAARAEAWRPWRAYAVLHLWTGDSKREGKEMKVRYATLRTPVGPVAVAWKGDTVVAVHMQEAKDRHRWDSPYVDVGPVSRLKEDLRRRFGTVELERRESGRPVRALKRYFASDPRALDTLTVDPGGTPFQAKVWRRLQGIPAGRTMTYGDLARSIGRAGASRATGAAVGRNPIPLIIPCHRVLGSDRRLTGFGGGLNRKQWLLEHEGASFRGH